MKKMISLALCLMLLLTVPFALAEGTQAAQSVGPMITAMGNASVTIVPDFATLNVGVSIQTATAAAAQEQNAAQMNAVIQALTDQGVSSEDMQTSNVSIYPVYDYSQTNEDGSQLILGYRADNTLLITVRDLDQTSAVLDAAITAGANQSYGLSFDSTKRAEAYDQAMALAVKEAARKAGLMADASGVKLGAMLSLTEQSIGYTGGYTVASKMMMDSAAGTPILNGTLTVEASVMMTFGAE